MAARPTPRRRRRRGRARPRSLLPRTSLSPISRRLLMPRTTISRSSLSRRVLLALSVGLGLSSSAEAQGAKPTSHTFKKGDPLWDISRTYLGDPFLWPQIYKLNTDLVKDPHWIYPNQVLRLVGAPERPSRSEE